MNRREEYWVLTEQLRPGAPGTGERGPARDGPRQAEAPGRPAELLADWLVCAPLSW